MINKIYSKREKELEDNYYSILAELNKLQYDYNKLSMYIKDLQNEALNNQIEASKMNDKIKSFEDRIENILKD